VLALRALIFAFTSLAAPSAQPAGCGEYEILGRIAKTGAFYELVVNEGSANELRLRVVSGVLSAAAHDGKSVRVYGELSREVKAFRGELHATKVQDRVLDPLRAAGAPAFRKLRAKDCLD
jgi:hypothetical protein